MGLLLILFLKKQTSGNARLLIPLLRVVRPEPFSALDLTCAWPDPAWARGTEEQLRSWKGQESEAAAQIHRRRAENRGGSMVNFRIEAGMNCAAVSASQRGAFETEDVSLLALDSNS